jgi:hypothetical protein
LFWVSRLTFTLSRLHRTFSSHTKSSIMIFKKKSNNKKSFFGRKRNDLFKGEVWDELICFFLWFEFYDLSIDSPIRHISPPNNFFFSLSLLNWNYRTIKIDLYMTMTLCSQPKCVCTCSCKLCVFRLLLHRDRLDKKFADVIFLWNCNERKVVTSTGKSTCNRVWSCHVRVSCFRSDRIVFLGIFTEWLINSRDRSLNFFFF